MASRERPWNWPLINCIHAPRNSRFGCGEVCATVKIGHFSQEGRELDLNQRVYDFIHDIADEVRTDEGTFTANQMMERFLSPGDLQSVPIGRLSGGERRRLYLLSVLMEAPNVLLLDEPTAMLDPRGRKDVIDTVKKLNREKGITIVLITHHMEEAATK